MMMTTIGDYNADHNNDEMVMINDGNDDHDQ